MRARVGLRYLVNQMHEFIASLADGEEVHRGGCARNWCPVCERFCTAALPPPLTDKAPEVELVLDMDLRCLVACPASWRAATAKGMLLSIESR